MKKILAYLLAVCLPIGMTACLRQETASVPPSQAERLSSEDQRQSAPVSESKAEEAKLPETSVSSPETDADAASSTPDPAAAVTKITVRPVGTTGEYEAFSITDNRV